MADWIKPEYQADATAHEVALAERYTRVTKTACEDWPDAHIVWLVVGPQRFRIADCETQAEAGFVCVNLAKAMRTVIGESLRASLADFRDTES